jgi:hypothetical protein
METATLVLAVGMAATAVLAPLGLSFDGGGLTQSRLGWRVRRGLFVAMTLVLGIGFVAMAAAGLGAVLGVDGVAAMGPLAWLWGPLLSVSTAMVARRLTPGAGRS